MSESNGRGESKALQGLAGRINACHEECEAAVRNGLALAVKTGNLLIDARERVQEAGGEWLPWVGKNCRFSKSQAQRYMRVADGYHALRQAAENPDGLSLSEALRLLRGAGRPAAKKAKDERIVVPSDRARREAVEGADLVRLPEDEAVAAFVRGQAEAVARHVLRLLKRKPPTNAAGQPIDSATAAVALLRQIQGKLDPALVVRAEPAPGDEPRPAAARRGHNRLNGKHPALAR